MPRLKRAVGASAAVVLAALVSCRRGESPVTSSSASVPAPTPAPVEAVESSDGPRTPRPAGGQPAVIWLGLDGLDWELLDRLSAEGKMPNWKRLVAEGASGKLTSFVPILSPVVWTTAATGVGPDVHRVLDFQEVDARTGQKVPVSGFSRAVPALWNLASASGRRVGVVGFWATHPAEQVQGFFVSDRASPILFEKLPLAGVAYPSNLEAGVAQVVARDGRIGAADLAPYLDMPPDAIAAELASGAGMEDKVVALSRILSATRVYQRIARDLYDRNHPDLMALYIEGTDEVGHVFASFVPPKLACVSDEDFRRYSRAVDVYYAAIDRILGQWMRRASEDGATLVVHSDHGFKWGADRPCERSSLNWATAGFWHRLDGVYAFWGKGVRPSAARGQASIFDVAPTVLGLLGLPPDTRMTGHALDKAFETKVDFPRRNLFAGVEVRRVAAEAMSPEQANEYTKKLLALGYLSGSEARPLAPAGGDAPGMTEGAWNNLGLYERERKNFPAAKAAFEKSLALRPDYHSPMFNLAVMYRDQHRLPLAEDWLFRSLAAGHADPEGTIDNWATIYRVEKRPADERRLLERAAARYPASEHAARELALARFRGHDCPGADSALAPHEATTNDPDTLNAIALVRTCLGRTDEAKKLFERSLQIKPDQPGVIQSLKLLRAAEAALPPGS
ncbi:MAG TPA: alkaline phosphatase family protein [Thermoanaerobaculia bacterium]|jgi:predicted AlkP superfamily phosphohydrolase/phosphomutase/Flp pilus assembly protein TadD